MYQNFQYGNYIGVDPNNKIMRIDNLCLSLDLPRVSTAYYAKDFGASHFTDFTHRFKARLLHTSEAYGDADAMLCLWAITNTPGNINVMSSANDGFVIYWNPGASQDIYLFDFNTDNYDSSVSMDADTTYYFKVVRVTTSLKVYIYNDEAETSLRDTLSIVCEAEAKRYVIPVAGYLTSDGASAAETVTGWMRDLDLGEAAAREQYSRTSSSELTDDAKFTDLMFEVMQTIDNTGYFRAVMSFIRDARTISTPGVCVWPKSDIEVDAGISNTGTWKDYAFDIGIAIKAKNDINVVAMVLKAREIIKAAFPRTLIYSNITGHFQTIVEMTDITGPEKGPSEMLLFGSGLIIKCRVQE